MTSGWWFRSSTLSSTNQCFAGGGMIKNTGSGILHNAGSVKRVSERNRDEHFHPEAGTECFHRTKSRKCVFVVE